MSLPPADDDLFPPIRPPTDVTAPQPDYTEEGEDTTADADADTDADADADAAMGDGSHASEDEESDEVSSSVQKIIFSPRFEDEIQDIEFIMEPANRSLDLRCAVRLILLFPIPHLSLQANQTRAAPCEFHATKRFSYLLSGMRVLCSKSRYSPCCSRPIIND